MRHVTLDDLRSSVGEPLGTSGWIDVTEDMVSAFAHATGAGPEYLALSLTNKVLPEIVEVAASAGLNVGTDQVRFPGPLAAGDRVRGHATLVSCTEVTGGVQTVMRITMEIENGDTLACVVLAVSRWLT